MDVLFRHDAHDADFDEVFEVAGVLGVLARGVFCIRGIGFVGGVVGFVGVDDVVVVGVIDGGLGEFPWTREAFLVEERGDAEHGDGEDDVKGDDFDEDGPDGFFGGAGDGLDHDAGHVGDGFDAGESEDDGDEGGPFVSERAFHGLDRMPADGEVGDGERRRGRG